MQTPTYLRKALSAVGALALVAVAAGCQATLTPDGSPYVVTSGSASVLVQSLPSTGTNERELTWDAQSPVQGDAVECATFETGQGIAQNGLAFDIHESGGNTTAIVIERNIWMDAFFAFVAIDFNTTVPGGFTVLPGGVNLSGYLGDAPVNQFPLRMCARIVGSTLQFEVAKAGDQVQPFLYSRQSGGVGVGGMISLAGVADATPGQTGVYEAHIPPGTSSLTDNIVLDGVPYTP